MSVSRKDSFLLEEYKALRAEVLTKLQHQLNLQQWSLIALVAVYTVAFTSDHLQLNADIRNRIWLIWWIPPLAMFLVTSVYLINDYVLHQISLYIQQIEEYFLHSEKPIGWESNQEKIRPSWSIQNPYILLILILTIVIAIVQTIRLY